MTSSRTLFHISSFSNLARLGILSNLAHSVHYLHMRQDIISAFPLPLFKQMLALHLQPWNNASIYKYNPDPTQSWWSLNLWERCACLLLPLCLNKFTMGRALCSEDLNCPGLRFFLTNDDKKKLGVGRLLITKTTNSIFSKCSLHRI